MAVDRYDKYCPFYKSVWMMRNIIHFYNLANQVDFCLLNFFVNADVTLIQSWSIDCIWLIEDWQLGLM